MAIRSKEFIGIAERIKNDEINTKFKIDELRNTIQNLNSERDSLNSTLRFLEASLAAAYEDTDDDGYPDYGRIAQIQSEIMATSSELSDVENSIDASENDLEKSESDFDDIIEEKQQTVFEIQERARQTSNNISLASGMYGAYASVGSNLQNSFQSSLSSLSQAASILDSSVSGYSGGAIGVAKSSSKSSNKNTPKSGNTNSLAAFQSNNNTGDNYSISGFTTKQNNDNSISMIANFKSQSAGEQGKKLSNYVSSQNSTTISMNSIVNTNSQNTTQNTGEFSSANSYSTTQIQSDLSIINGERCVKGGSHNNSTPNTISSPAFKSISGNVKNQSYIPASEIKDVNSNEVSFWNHHSNSKEDYIRIASKLPEVQSLLNEGKSLNEIRAIPGLRDTVNAYYDNVVKVESYGGNLHFQDDGRHRIAAARELGYSMPVKVINVDSSSESYKYNSHSVNNHSFNRLAEYMSSHNYSISDYSIYSKDPEWQKLHRAVYPDSYRTVASTYENSKIALQNYMNAHGFTVADYGIYVRDKEWQRLHKAVYPDYEPSKQVSIAIARQALMEYMYSNNYTPYDYHFYSKDPKWQLLHNTVYNAIHHTDYYKSTKQDKIIWNEYDDIVFDSTNYYSMRPDLARRQKWIDENLKEKVNSGMVFKQSSSSNSSGDPNRGERIRERGHETQFERDYFILDFLGIMKLIEDDSVLSSNTLFPKNQLLNTQPTLSMEYKHDHYLQNQIFSLIDNPKSKYSKSYWNYIDVKKKKEILNDLLKEINSLFGTDVNPLIKFSFMDPNSRGYYNHSKKEVCLNENYLTYADGYQIVFTLIHEMRHAYQHLAVENPEKVIVSQKTIELWRNNFLPENYRKPATDGFEAYIGQPIEWDAKNFAKQPVYSVTPVYKGSW